MTIQKHNNQTAVSRNYAPQLPNINQLVKIQTIDQAINSTSGSIRALTSHESTSKQCAASVVEIVLNFVEFISVSRNMNEKQVLMTAQLIMEDFAHLRLEDVQLALKNAAKGKYGQFYESMDGTKILGFIRQYDNERAAHCEDIAMKSKKNDDQVFCENVKMLKNIIQVPETMLTPKQENTREIANHQNEIISKIYNQFDRIFKMNGVVVAGVKFIEIRGKRVSFQEFIELKIK